MTLTDELKKNFLMPELKQIKLNMFRQRSS